MEEEIDRVMADGADPVDWLELMPHVRAAFEETMRLYPPAPSINRAPIEDDTWTAADVIPAAWRNVSTPSVTVTWPSRLTSQTGGLQALCSPAAARNTSTPSVTETCPSCSGSAHTARTGIDQRQTSAPCNASENFSNDW